jgi:hypothetical protein
MFASSFRLDLNIIVGPEKPGQIKTILSGHLPILIDYLRLYRPQDITDSVLWRMRTALRHRDRVREISFKAWDAIFRKFITATNYHFPALESLILSFPQGEEADIPPTFLRPDLSDLRLRRLTLCGVSLASVSGLLLSATALTDLTLIFTSTAAVSFDSSQGSLLLACLRGMRCLRSLNLTTPCDLRDSQSQHSTPKDIVPLLNLTDFHYLGSTMFLNDFMSGLSAPSLQDARFLLFVNSPLLYLSRVIDDLREEFRSVSVTFDVDYFYLLSSTHLARSDQFKPSFRLHANHYPDSINPINSIPSTKLAAAEELALLFPDTALVAGRQYDLRLREFLRQFRSVKVLRLDRPFVPEIALSLQQDDGDTLLPLLEEIELSVPRSTKGIDEEYQLAAFEPFVSAREHTGRPVNVFHREMPSFD